MCLWFTARGNYSKKMLLLYQLMFWFTLLGKNAIMVFIQAKLDTVSCENFTSGNVGTIIAKALAIIFMSVRILSNIPERLMMRYSTEYVKAGRCPFALYIAWQVITDMYITWLAVTLALAKEQVIDVFANFAALLIFTDAELILGTFATMVLPIKEDTNYLVFHVNKSQFIARKKRHARSVLVFTTIMFVLYILVTAKIVPGVVFGHCKWTAMA
jgi:hypothetical protein